MKSMHPALFAVLAALQIYSAALYAADTKTSATTNSAPEGQSKELEHRRKWNLDTLVGDYERHGRRSPKWDEPAKAGLAIFARVRSLSDTAEGNELSKKVAAPIKTAVINGCDDPMVGYLYARYVTSQETHTPKEQAEAFRSAAEALGKSEYAPVRKFYAALRIAIVLNPDGRNTPPEVHDWRRHASQYLNQAVKDPAMPVAEVYEACDQLLQTVNNNARQYEEFYRAFEPAIFKNWPSEPSLYLLKGIFYTKYAWHARGTAYANKVTDKGWQLFSERLAEAETALDKAWEMNPRDPRVACEMLSVELGQGKGRERMELWFKRATDLNPNYYDAFSAKLYYLEPKWHGSPEEMLKFGRECVDSKKWGGHVPLILRDAHEALARYLDKEEQPDYWKRPEVWKDLKAAFEKFFKLNPDEIGWRHNYALYAYRAEQWEDLNRQIPLLGEINYEFFGGKEAYDKMVRLARDHSRK
ncbi:MAG TPA: hypothetical protein VL361_06335 [Candidatus Limnocylindrales bacterium]|nr:hypothetical protein [Candidatus Limnocylindrales bacterium]